MPEGRSLDLPELTRSLRAFGSPRAARRADAERFFAPLLTARRRGAEAGSPFEILTAFDPDALAARYSALADAFAAERHRARGAARRALAAELEELIEPVRAAIEDVRTHARPLLDDARASRQIEGREWDAWVASVRATFEAADRSWGAIERVLGSPAAPSRGKGT